MLLAKRIVAITLLVLAIVLTWMWVADFLAIDACLDSGGSYDYERRVCDHRSSHPPGERRGRLLLGGALASAVAAVLLFKISLGKQRQ